MSHMLPSSLALALGVAALPAQASLLVGPNGLPDLQTAIDLASPGDEILVEPGSYAPFSLTKPLTMRAQQPGTVSVQAGGLVLPLAQLTGRAQFVGIDFDKMSCAAGDFAFEDCSFAWTGSVLALTNGTSHLERCTILGLPSFLGSGPLAVNNAQCTMVDCVVEGPPAGPLLQSSRAVDLLSNSTLVASGCTFLAGGGSISDPAIMSTSSPTGGPNILRISDSTLVAAPSICAILDFGATDMVLSRCSASSACANQVTGPLLGALANGAITRGQTWSATFRGQPGQPVLVLASDGLEASQPALLSDPFLLGTTGSVVVGALALDVSGDGSLSFSIPLFSLPPGVAVFVQAVSGSSFPLQASPVLGGLVR